MAGRGRAPKDPSQRVNRHVPARGEWVNLEPLEAPVLPEWQSSWTCPEDLWVAWRSDAVTSQYGPADVAACVLLGREFAALRPNEQRLRMDGLGLTPLGKRNLRWRTPAEVATLGARAPATVRKLRAV